MPVVLGVKCSKDGLEWAVLDGQDRRTVAMLELQRAQVPPAQDRGQELVWVRNVVLALVTRFGVAEAAVQATESRGQTVLPARAELDGVVQEALAFRGVPVTRLVTTSLHSRYGVRKKDDFNTKTAELPIVAGTAASRQAPLLAALALLPDSAPDR